MASEKTECELIFFLEIEHANKLYKRVRWLLPHHEKGN